jgi:hypothetical protein
LLGSPWLCELQGEETGLEKDTTDDALDAFDDDLEARRVLCYAALFARASEVLHLLR